MAAEAEAKLLKLLGSGADEEVAARAPQQTQRTDSESRTATAPDLANAALRAYGELPPGSVDYWKRNDEFEHSLRSTLQETDFEALKAASKKYMQGNLEALVFVRQLLELRGATLALSTG